MPPLLPNDTELKFPDLTVVSASAGSGKTHTLTLRYLQFILSEHIRHNKLNNILAITFTNNAAREMKQRILEYLKKASLGDAQMLNQLSELLPMDASGLRERSGAMVDILLDNYSEFQIHTIDSFLSRVFRSSALEFGFSPSLEIVLNNNGILTEAFEQFARELARDPAQRAVLDGLIEILIEQHDARYLWNPFDKLAAEVKKLYGTLSNQRGDVVPDTSSSSQLKELKGEILKAFDRLHALVKQSGFEIQKNFLKVVDAASTNDIDDLIRREALYNSPIKKPGAPLSKQEFERWLEQFQPHQERLRALANEYTVQKAHRYYQPYVHAHIVLKNTIERVMRQRGQIYIADVNRELARYVSAELVPNIYYYLGENIFHYLIDEFQDTSPVQWATLQPLVDNSLAQGGSLFVVGDTKQSIYSFRGADWRIMKSLMEESVFPSAPPQVKTLASNFRSEEKILAFTKEVFHNIVPAHAQGGAERASGLSTFEQNVKPGFEGKGYVEVSFFKKDEELFPEKNKLLEIVADCNARGYSYGEIIILTPKNDTVVAISSWLNERHIPFISHSSLDIRSRKLTRELIALLRFLDTPIDDLSFTTFLLGDVFQSTLSQQQTSLALKELHTFIFQARQEHRTGKPLYILFRERYPSMWKHYFEELFSVVGYLPLYDLISEIYASFDLFRSAKNEEGALIKFLEVIKNFEDGGQNNLKDFLAFTEEEDEDSQWTIPVPTDADAVAVMTIHKAKGLDNRVVIVLLPDGNPRADNLFIEEAEDGVHLIRITKEIAEADDGLATLYAQKQFERKVDELNKLYVAFTRAEEEMYILSIKTDRAKEPSAFLPQSGYEPKQKPAVRQSTRKEPLTAPLFYHTHRPQTKVTSIEGLGLYERKRGELVHEILSNIEFIENNATEQINKAIEPVGGELEDGGRSILTSLLSTFLALPEIAPYFAKRTNRTILNEQEFAQPNGQLFRMDRIVVDPDAVTVIDYKTGDEKEDYREQVLAYMTILREFYSKHTIRGLLAYVDKKIIREVH